MRHHLLIVEAPEPFEFIPAKRPPFWRPLKLWRWWRARRAGFVPLIFALPQDAELIAKHLMEDSMLDVVRVVPHDESGTVSVTLRKRGEPQTGMPKWIEEMIKLEDCDHSHGRIYRDGVGRCSTCGATKEERDRLRGEADGE